LLYSLKHLRPGGLASPASHSTAEARRHHRFDLSLRLPPSARDRVRPSPSIAPGLTSHARPPNLTGAESGRSAVRWAMWRVYANRARVWDGVTRRSFLQAGVLGLGGLALLDLLRLRASGSAAGPGGARSVILFWLSGGPGHMETWDPKPDAPRDFRGSFG